MDGGGGQSQIAQGEDIFRKVKDLQVFYAVEKTAVRK